MKYFSITVFFVLSFYAAAAQSLEEKAAAKSCECLSKEKIVTEPVLRTCISHSLTEVAIGDSTKKYLRQLSSVESIQSSTKKVYALLLKQCNRAAIKPRDN